MLRQLFQAYPWSFITTVALPVVLATIGGLVGSVGGFANLKHQFEGDQQSQRIEEGVNAISGNNTALQTSLRMMEAYNNKLEAAGKRDTVLIFLITQYQQLSRATALFGQLSHTDSSQDQGKVAIEILKILNQDVVRTFVRDDLPGRHLIIEIAPNTFRVINPVPMARPPDLTFTDLPQGVSAVVSDKSEISFTVSFFPMSILALLDRDDLPLAEPVLPHSSVPSCGGRTLPKSDVVSGAQVRQYTERLRAFGRPWAPSMCL